MSVARINSDPLLPQGTQEGAAAPAKTLGAAPAAKAERAATPEGKAVIRKMSGAEESRAERLLKKHLPAWVVSGAVHVALIVTLIVADSLMGKPAPVEATDASLTIVAATEQAEEPPPNLIETVIGIEPSIPPAIEAKELAVANVMSEMQDPKSAVGVEDAKIAPPQDFTPPPGVSPGDAAPGVSGDAGMFTKGEGSNASSGAVGNPLNGRNSGTRSKMAEAGGGNTASEAAVARSILWLERQQVKPDPKNPTAPFGYWVFDGEKAADTPAATGMALLPFLAAGQTHKSTEKDNKYKNTVLMAANWLTSPAVQKPDGSFANATNLYSHAIATVALCELLGMTSDRALEKPCQLAINYIVAAQASNGSWGYDPKSNGDTSIVGWQVQALYSAKLCKNLKVDKAVFQKASKFLDSVAEGTKMSQYGYNSRRESPTEPEKSTPSLTAVGLLVRYYADGWGPQQPGMASGVKYLLQRKGPTDNDFNIYYYYYATQVMHFFQGDEWERDWNPKMRDRLISMQVKEGEKEAGSWNKDGHQIGKDCGRLGTTCMALLTLEVYYRHLPTYKRDTQGLNELERGL